MGYNVNNGGNILFNINSKNSATREKGLQNKVVDNILKVVRSPKNQINLHMPIDIGVAQAAADNSTAGEVVKHVTADNPFVKYMMQVQNMVGKQVIGITAVSIKAFFAATYYYNDKIRQFENELISILNDVLSIKEDPEILRQYLDDSASSTNYEEWFNARYITPKLNNTIYSYLKEILLINPLNNKVTCYANLNFDNLIRLVESKPELANFVINRDAFLPNTQIQQGLAKRDNSPLTLLELLTTLRTKSMSEDATLNLSALLSCATDNAKELVLSKINATSKFVDIYTYLLTLGVDFNTIANIMKSPVFNEVVKLTETDIFNEATSKYNLEKALDFYIDLKVLPGVDRDVVKHFAPDFNLYWYKNPKLPRNFDIDTALTNAQNYLKKLGNKSTEARVEEEENRRQAADEKAVEGIVSENRDFVTDPITRQEVLNVIDFFKKCKDRQLFLNNLGEASVSQIANLRIIKDKILPAMKEMEILGAMLGVNQGLRTNDYDQYAFIKRVEDFIRDRFEKTNFQNFNLMRFLTDQQYQDLAIQTYDKVKSTYNILSIITTVPHFKEMFKTLALNNSLISSFSITYNLERDAINNLLPDSNGNKPAIGADQFRMIKNTINDEIILNGIKSMNLKIKLPQGFKYMKGTPDNWEVSENNDDPISLDSNINIANFKKLMDEVLIPQIIAAYPNEDFIKALTRAIKEDRKDHRQKFFWRLVLHMMNIDSTVQTQTMYENILKSFDGIAHDTINGWKIADLFYLYNLIVNKDSFGGDSFTRLFENLSISQNTSTLINQFYDYLSKLDNDEISFNLNMDNIEYRLSKMKGSNIRSRIVMYNFDPNYFTFDLPFDSDGGARIIVSTVLLNPTPIDDQSHFQNEADQYDILVPLIQEMNEKFGTNIHIINAQQASENERAYIENGELYINVDKADITDILHELGHCIFAVLKQQNPEQYYTMMNIAMQNPSFQEIAKAYPNKHGSDLQEEVFLKLMQQELQGILYSKDSPLLNSTAQQSIFNIVEQLSSTYKAKGTNNTRDLRVGVKSLLNAIFAETDSMFRQIDKGLVILSQKTATIKNNLVQDQSLKEDCSNL